MEDHSETLQKFLDINLWLFKVAVNDEKLSRKIIKSATKATAEHFKLPLYEVKELITKPSAKIAEEERLILEFYFEFISNMSVSQK